MTHTASRQGDGDPGVDTLSDKVIAEIANALNLDHAEVRPECSFYHDFRMSNLDAQALRFHLQQAFRLTIPSWAVADFDHVSDVIAYIEHRLASDGSAG